MRILVICSLLLAARAASAGEVVIEADRINQIVTTPGGAVWIWVDVGPWRAIHIVKGPDTVVRFVPPRSQLRREILQWHRRQEWEKRPAIAEPAPLFYR